MRPGPVLLLALGALLGAPACSLFATDPPQNLLVIAVDGLRLDALKPVLGAPHMPNVQRLAGSGISFSWCFSPSSATLPAVASILSARGPTSSRVRVDRQDVPTGVALLAEHLRERGWQTLASMAPPDVRAAQLGKGVDRGFHLARTHARAPASAVQVNAEMVPMLERASPDLPWFAFVEYADPTAPYAAHGTEDRSATILLDGRPLETIGVSDPVAWSRNVRIGRGEHRLEVRSDDPHAVASLEVAISGEALALEPVDVRAQPGQHTTCVRFRIDAPFESEVELRAFVHDDPGVEELRARYKLEVEAVDRAIGELVAVLERNGQYDRTCIVVVAPHGEALGERGHVGHGAGLHDELLRVPLIVRPALNDPARAQLVRRRLDVVRLIDVAPTLLELLGEDALPGAEGVSLLRDADRTVLAEVYPPQAEGAVVGLRDERYKLVFVAAEDRFEMYDVKSDTLELENVFALQGHFRTKWQARLRDLAERAPESADERMGRLGGTGRP